MGEAPEGRELGGPVGGAAGRHVDLLVPFEHRRSGAQVEDFA